MKQIAALISLLALSFSIPSLAQTQAPKSPEEEAKMLRETIDKEVDRLAELLDLEDWQIFYVDSTLTYNIGAMMDERKQMQTAKVTNTDLYYLSMDKWSEKTDQQYEKIFSKEQWDRYMNTGGRKAKKAREKRAEKAQKADANLKNKK